MFGQLSIDYLLCEECTDILLDQLDQQFKIIDDEFKDYKVFFNKLNDKLLLDIEVLLKEFIEFRVEEEELIRKLAEVEKEREKVVEKMEIEKERFRQMVIDEKKYWKDYSEYQKQFLEY